MKKVEALAKLRMEEKSQKMAEKEIRQKQIDKSKEDKKSKAYLARHKTKKSWHFQNLSKDYEVFFYSKTEIVTLRD